MITTNINGNAISQAFIDEVRSDSPDMVARLVYNGNVLDCDIVSIEVSKGSCGSDEFTIGSVVGDCLTATVKGLAVDVKGGAIDCQIGAFTGADYEYISLGQFTVSQVTRTRYESQIVAYSSVVSKTTGLYSVRDPITGVTLADIADNITLLTGVSITFDTGIDTTQVVTQSLYGLTLYNALQVLAVCSGGYVISASDGSILVKRFNTTPNVSIDTGMMVSLPQIEEQPFTVNTIRCVVSSVGADGEEVVYTTFVNEPLTGYYNGTEVDIDPIDVVAPATQADIEISNAYVNRLIFYTNTSAVIGYSYYPAEMNVTLGDPRLEGCDVVDLVDVDGTHYIVPCHQIKHKYKNGFSTSITAVRATAKENDIGTAMPITAKIEEVRQSMVEAVENTADLITGNNGGYVVIKYNDENKPEELLIMDSPDIESAVNVWRWNQGGLGHSHNGYQGPYDDVALTADGKINASMITTGILSANLIKAGTIADDSGENYWNLTSGEFSTKKGTIGSFTIDNQGLTRRRSASKLEIYGSSILSARKSSYDTGLYYTSMIQITGTRLEFGYTKDSEDFDSVDLFAYFDLQPTTTGFPVLELRTPYSYPNNQYAFLYDPTLVTGNTSPINLAMNTTIAGNLRVTHEKSRIVDTDNYSKRLLYCYETSTPLFGDIGEAVIGEDGLAYVEIDDIFTETIAEKVEYQVFLQKEGQGDCYIAEKTPRYFVVKGTPNMKVAWELKAKQKGYELTRIEEDSNPLEEYKAVREDKTTEEYITTQEELLYG